MPTGPRRPQAHRKRQQRQARRLRAAELFTAGIHPAEVARQLGVSRQAASTWHAALDHRRRQRPCKPRPDRARDQAVIDHWVKIDWPRFKKARRRAAAICFFDESGLSLTPCVRSTWAPRGQPPLLVHPFNWK
jgi:hypothetical protein